MDGELACTSMSTSMGMGMEPLDASTSMDLTTELGSLSQGLSRLSTQDRPFSVARLNGQVRRQLGVRYALDGRAGSTSQAADTS